MRWEPLFSLDLSDFKRRLSSLRPMVVFDIGAHKGLYVQDWIDSGAEVVYCFEPVPYFREIITGVWGSDSRVRILPQAIADSRFIKCDCDVFNVCSIAARGSRNDVTLEHAGRDSFDVEFIDLDGFGVIPDFVKMDVDGYEFRALRGMRRIMVENRPLFYYEFSHLPKFILGDSPEEMCRFIYSVGYVAASLSGWICQSPDEMMRYYPDGSSYDVMLIPNEKI